MFTDSFLEDLVANSILGVGLVLVVCFRDFCKRVSHSDCVLDREHGLAIRLPTWRPQEVHDDDDDNVQQIT